MKKRSKTLLALAASAVLAFGTAACSDSQDTASQAGATTTASALTTAAQASTAGDAQAIAATNVGSVDQLVSLVQEAYGDPSLGLHRGHQPVESVLIDVLGISHEEMHVRMESQGQNLAAIATDLGIDPQTLIDALVESWAPAIDDLREAGTITDAQADAYRQALEDAFTFRVTWNGTDATPAFTGIA